MSGRLSVTALLSSSTTVTASGSGGSVVADGPEGGKDLQLARCLARPR